MRYPILPLLVTTVTYTNTDTLDTKCHVTLKDIAIAWFVTFQKVGRAWLNPQVNSQVNSYFSKSFHLNSDRLKGQLF